MKHTPRSANDPLYNNSVSLALSKPSCCLKGFTILADSRSSAEAEHQIPAQLRAFLRHTFTTTALRRDTRQPT
jgi:hypothetical protein